MQRTEEAAMTTPTDPGISQKAFNAYRHAYLRVTTRGQTRLQTSTFLAGLTFAAFAASLATPYIATPLSVPPDIGKLVQDPLWLNSALQVLAGTLLALTTYLAIFAQRTEKVKSA